MKNKIVLVPFPFDDLTKTKTRPALCLTGVIKPYQHVVIAFITSTVDLTPASTDLVIDMNDPDFGQRGLKVSSTIKLHRLATVSRTLFQRDLGVLPLSHQNKVEGCLRALFEL
jgi:mRNA interferase MazF